MPQTFLVAVRLRGARLLFVFAAALAAPAVAAAATPPVVASAGDAYVAHESGSDTWTLGTSDLELVVGLDPSRTLAIQRFSNPATGEPWPVAASEGRLTIGGQPVAMAAGGSVSFVGGTATAEGAGVRVTFTFQLRSPRLQITRTYACYSGSPTVETWTRVTSLGDSAEVSGLTGWDVSVPAARVRLVSGLRGDTATTEGDSPFQIIDRDLEAGERLEIGASGRSSEQFVPFVQISGDGERFFGGTMWSGSWRMAIERSADRLRITSSFPGIATTVSSSRPLELPHAFFGMTANAEDGADAAALQRFVVNGIRAGRPFAPLVTYNTWFAYGTRVDEDTIVAEMDRAAALGVELFVLDAGWWVGAGENDDFDFESNLGSWTPDADRFPSGLASLSDYAHGLGMKFGLWVEPERVALSTVNKPGLARERWLATAGGDYNATRAAQICLAQAEARQWLLERLTALIDQVRPDYLKWDNNFWINCDRAGHDHGPSDGNFAHVRALYGLLAELRNRYPDLMIENVSGGGNRLDFGMLAFSDVAWMDDRTAPSVQVRHNLEGLTTALPPGYLLSFLLDTEAENIYASTDLLSMVRSRMPGVFGLTYRSSELNDELVSTLQTEIERYKTYRLTIAGAAATLLTEQAPVAEQLWDVVQEVDADGSSAVIFAFKDTNEPGRLLIRPRGLRADVNYQVFSVDVGALGVVPGATLMSDGVEANHTSASPSRAHIFIITPQ